jgi:hypothetical protein
LPHAKEIGVVSGGHEEQLRRWAELALDQQESAERAVRGVVENEPDIIRNGLEMGGFSGCAFCAHKFSTARALQICA